MTKKTKILFTHNTAMWYRLPFFKRLSQIYDLDLVFTHINVIDEIYDNKLTKQIKGLEGVNYTILDNSHGFCKGLLSKVNNNTDIVIGGSWDSPQELIETILLFIKVKIHNKPFIIWREDWDWKKDDNLKEKLLTWIIKYISNHSNAILVPGTLHKKYFEEKLEVDSNKIHIMPNVSNISGFEKIDKNMTNIKKILYVGRLIPRKGVKYLLDAYKNVNLELDNTELIIIGTGKEELNLKNYVIKNNIPNVTFTGKVENDELKEYYKNASLVVVPSINEGMADPWVFVLNEAMYYANPIIATTAVGAAPDMIKDNGYIVLEKNSNQLSEAIIKILKNDDTIIKMGTASRKIIDTQFQYENMINGFSKAINYVKNKIN